MSFPNFNFCSVKNIGELEDQIPETYLESRQRSKRELFAKMLTALDVRKAFRRRSGHLLNVLCSFKPLPIFIKSSTLDVYLSSEYDSKYVVRSQPAFTCSKLTIETLEQGVKYVQS